MDPKLRAVGDGVGAADTTGPLLDRFFFFRGQSQGMGLVDLSLVKSEREQSSGGVPLRRRQERRRCHESQITEFIGVW